MKKDHFLFFTQNIYSGTLVLNKSEKHHAVSVLRVSDGDPIRVTDGKGIIYECCVNSVEKDQLTCTILEKETISRTKPEITVAVGLPDRSEFEEILQTLTALGVRKILPLITENSRKPWWDKWQKYKNRFEEKMVVSMKQCLYPYMPNLENPVTSTGIANYNSQLILIADQLGEPLRNLEINGTDKVLCLIGPPGGFTHNEQDFFSVQGAVKVKLASNRLRTELAAITFCSQIAAFCDM
ncbi:16S ribosomal RNA methyltransferase RsmE [Chitinispirillum alkaliphilum]|nr:16S ribosomal RNA methyltransferase RsmE [Chitinispirillum alkaliphilum]